jgi:hypothetical protein
MHKDAFTEISRPVTMSTSLWCTSRLRFCIQHKNAWAKSGPFVWPCTEWRYKPRQNQMLRHTQYVHLRSWRAVRSLINSQYTVKTLVEYAVELSFNIFEISATGRYTSSSSKLRLQFFLGKFVQQNIWHPPFFNGIRFIQMHRCFDSSGGRVKTHFKAFH